MNTLYFRNPNQIFTDIDGEIIMINVKYSEYYNLPGTAGIIWKYLEKPSTLKEIIEQLIAEYEISYEDCLTDVEPFIQEMLNKKIVNAKYA